MNRLFFTLLGLFLMVGAVRAQNPNDSIRFVDRSSWRVVHQTPQVEVRQLIPCALFDARQRIYVVEARGARFGLAEQDKKRRVKALARQGKASVAVNGGFFVVDTHAAVANDFLKIDGTVRSPIPSSGWGSGAVGFDARGGAHFTHWNRVLEADTAKGWSAAFPNVLAAGPMLVFEGRGLFAWRSVDKKALTDDQKRGQYAPRTAVGVKADGTVVLLVVDGRTDSAYGASFEELTALGRWLGVEYLLNLDGGGSTTLVVEGRTINRPSDGAWIFRFARPVANALLVWDK